MRVAHVAVVTPHRTGLYETTRDLVAAERKLGINARIIDPVNEYIGNDRGVPIVKANFARKCQVIVNHSGLGEQLREIDKPIVHMLHGRPYSSFLLEQMGKIRVYSYWQVVRNDERFRAFVTFWPEFLPYFRLMLPEDKLHVLPPPVDLTAWTPDGPEGYDFHGKRGPVNVVCTDIWRRDRDPYHVINAFSVLARRLPSKLHIYAAPEKGTAWGLLKLALGEGLGEVCGFIDGLDNVYRAANVLITPKRSASRSVREALACGCNVVMAPGNDYTTFQADPEDVERYAQQIAAACLLGDRTRNRRIAEERFDSLKTAALFIKLLKDVANGS